MKSYHRKMTIPSVILCWITYPARLIDRFAWRVLKVDRYEVVGQSIVLHKGLFKKLVLKSSEIVSWSVYPEMGMDVVRIELVNSQAVTWIDEYNDLLECLRMLVPDKFLKKDYAHVQALH
jgi:hypothetical protein